MYLGISVIPHLDDWLVHHPDHKVLLCHFVSATKHARLKTQIIIARALPNAGYPVS